MSTGVHPAPRALPGRRERRKQEVRERLLTAARELFAKQGFEATTVEEIARVADVVPATFFNHFQTKQALLGLMAGEVFETVHSMAAQHLEGPGSSIAKLRRFVGSVGESITSSRAVARDVFLEFLKSDAKPDEPHPYLDRLIGPFVALVAEGQARGEIRRDRSAAFLAQMAVGMMNSAITSWLADPDYPVETGLPEAAEFAIETLTARPAATRTA